MEDEIKVGEYGRTNLGKIIKFAWLQDENGIREKNKNLQKELEEKDMQHELELIGKEEFTKANMAEIIEHYYTANEDCIPISKLKEKIEELTKIKGDLATYIATSERIKVLQELLEESEK